MFNFVDSSPVPVLEQVINFAQRRHDVLAGNIANMDTPGYRTRDLNVDEFQNRLQDALETRAAAHSSNSSSASRAGVAQIGTASSPGFNVDTQPDDALREVSRNLEDILRHDDSNISLEQQVTAVSKNQFMHNMAVALLRSQYDVLRAAVTERV